MLRPLSRRTLLTVRWQCDDNTTDIIHTSHTEGDSIRRSTLLRYEHDIRHYLVHKEKTEEEGNQKEVLDSPLLQKKWWLGSFVVVGELKRIVKYLDHFIGDSKESFKLRPFVNDHGLSIHRKRRVPQQASQVWYSLSHRSLRKLVEHFKSLWDFRLLWLNVYD
jgi:hypothetical protein